MTARDVLAEIEQRADLAKRDESLIWLGDHDEALKLAIPEARERLIEKDAPAMVAALRAVLDVHRPLVGPDGVAGVGICTECEQYTPCPTAKAITDALSGVTAGTDR